VETYENRDRRIRKVCGAGRLDACISRASAASFTRRDGRQIINSPRPSAQEFIPPVDAIVKGALDMLGESAVTHASERRFDKADRRTSGGNAGVKVDGSAVNIPEHPRALQHRDATTPLLAALAAVAASSRERQYS
jgi:hypothetical protein